MVIPSVPTVELELHSNRIPNHYQVMTYDQDMQPLTERASSENCFYHGRVSNYEDSFVVIDGCQAPNIKGYISVDGQVLVLEPAEDDNGGHILRAQFSRSALRTFFSSKLLPKKNLLEEDELPEEDTLVRESRQLGPSMPPLFIEIYVVCDYELYEEFNRDNRTLTAKIQMIVEVLKEIYLDFGVYIHLSGISIWTNGNLIRPINNGLRDMFNSFLRWRPRKQLPAHDFPILISGSDYSGSGSNVPASHKSQMCSKYHTGLAVKGVNLDDPVLPSLLARTIGGSMGLLEVDPDQCPCSDPSGCIMDSEFRGWTHGPPTKFSSCSKQHLWNNLRAGRINCLLNQPAGFVLPPRCGDGNVDDGEDCDCGDEGVCLDICCDPTTCTFDYILPECRPTTQPPSTTEEIYPTTSEATTPITTTTAATTTTLPSTTATTTAEPATTPPVYETTFVEDFVTELDDFPYDATTSVEEQKGGVASPTVATLVTTSPAITERPLTEDERRIRQIKELLGLESIQAPPSLIQGPAVDGPEYFTSGSNVTLPCQAFGLPLPRVSWYKNQEELYMDKDPRLVIDDGSLKIVGADASDTGDYYCKANNTHGVVISESVSLSLAFLDSLPSTLEEVREVNETEPLVLGCQVPDSNPPPDVYWTKDLDSKVPLELTEGVSLTPDGDLVISSARPEHSGEYTCVVSNAVAGEVRFAQGITVKVHALSRAPVWQYTSPQQMMAQLGKPFSLHCIPSGSPVPSVTWEKMFGGGEGTEVKGHGPTLTILSPVGGDSGQYRCTATNGVRESTKEVFNVTVEGSPEWVVKPTNVEIPAGSSHSIYCAANGIPLPDIFWLVNGKPAQVEVAKYPHLSFSSEPGSGVFNISDGIYLNVVLQCVAENRHGKLLANAYVNIIVFPARIISPPPPLISVLEGQDVRIPCRALGAPEPDVYWQVGIKSLEAEDDGSLFIQSAGTGDANNYYCRARNSYGLEDRLTTLHVRGLTRVAILTDEVSLEEESELILTCQVEHYADSPPEIRWSVHDGRRPLDLSRTLIEVNHDMTRSSLLIERLTLDDAGLYTCTATTDYDQAADQAYVEVTEKIVILPPIKPGNITTSRSYSGLLVMWESEYLLNAPIDSLLIEARNNYYPDQWTPVIEVPGTEDSALVQVNPYVTYWFRVTARNVAGQSVSPRSRPVAMPSSTPLTNPANVQIDVSIPGTVTVSWEEMGPLQHAGPKFFYRIRWRPIGTKKWKDHKIRDHTVTEYTFEMDPGDSAGLEVAVKSGNFIGSGPKATFVSAYFVQPTTVAPLLFDVEPPIFSRVMEGRDFQLNCSGVGGKELQTSWYKDGLLLENDSTNYTISGDGSLLITTFGYEDVGAYVCTIVSATGESISSLTNLEIRWKTRVTVLPPSLEASESTSIEVFCDIEFDTNIASADIVWLDPSNSTVGLQSDFDDARVFRNDSSLIIEGVMLSDAGTYTCIAETDEDYAEAPFTLVVKAPEPPKVSPQLLVVQIQDSRSLSASWGSVSDEEAGGRVLGYFAVARLRGEVQNERKECYSTTNSCLFLELTPRLTYEVFVAVRTASGQGPFSPAVYVTMPEPEPVRPGPVKIGKTRVWSKTLTIRWTAPTVGDPLYGYLLSYKAEGGQSGPERTLSPSANNHKLVGLEPGTTYIVSIQAYNSAGRGEKVTTIVNTKRKSV